MSRLASLAGPSTPSPKPVSPQRPAKRASPSPSPASQQQQPPEGPIHRRVRSILLDIRAFMLAWDDCVVVQGGKAVRALVDARTEIDNALSAKGPIRKSIVKPRLDIINDQLSILDALLLKLETLFKKLTTCESALDTVVVTTARARGPAAIAGSLWSTTISRLVPPYHRSLLALRLSLEKLHDPELTFDEGKAVLRLWTDGVDGALHGGKALGLDNIGIGVGTWTSWKECEEVWEVEVGGWK